MGTPTITVDPVLPSSVTPTAGVSPSPFRRVPSWLSEGLSGHWHPSTELCLTHSDDDGATWTSPQVYLAGGQCPNLRRLADGTLIHHTHRFELVNEAIFETIRSLRLYDEETALHDRAE